MSVAEPILTTSISPYWINSYSFDRPMPVIFTAVGMRTLSNVKAALSDVGGAAPSEVLAEGRLVVIRCISLVFHRGEMIMRDWRAATAR